MQVLKFASITIFRIDRRIIADFNIYLVRKALHNAGFTFIPKPGLKSN